MNSISSSLPSLGQIVDRVKSKLSAAEAGSAPKESFDFSSLPHADFDTNLAKLRSNSAAFREVGSERPSNTPPDFNETISNTDVNQSAIEQKLVNDLGPELVHIQNHQDLSKLNGRIPTKSELDSEFAKLAANPEIPFEYIYDGCYARAHLMCETMMADNINNGKIFCMVDDPYNKENRLEAENKYMHAKWWYHVAPVVFAENDTTHQVEAYVMDPSMNKSPMKADEWIHAMWNEKDKIHVDFTRNPQFGPAETGEVNKTFEESIPPSHEVCAEYSKELAKIKEDYNASHPGQPSQPARLAA